MIMEYSITKETTTNIFNHCGGLYKKIVPVTRKKLPMYNGCLKIPYGPFKIWYSDLNSFVRAISPIYPPAQSLIKSPKRMKI